MLYQLSKNLNRPFFMDFLTTLSVRYAHGHVCDEEDPEEDGALLNQMDNYLKPSAKVECKIAIVIKTCQLRGKFKFILKTCGKNLYIVRNRIFSKSIQICFAPFIRKSLRLRVYIEELNFESVLS